VRCSLTGCGTNTACVHVADAPIESKLHAEAGLPVEAALWLIWLLMRCRRPHIAQHQALAWL
jgi:hypothetical protein